MEDRSQRRKISRPLLVGGHLLFGFARRLPDTRALVREEKEGLILAVVDFRNQHRPTECCAKLIALQPVVLLRAVVFERREEIGGVQVIVPQILKCRAVKLIRARTRDRIHNAANVAAELGVEGIGLHAEFLQGVGIRHGIRSVAVVVVVLSSVQNIVGRIGPAAIHRYRCDPWIRRSGSDVRVNRIGLDAGHQLHQLSGIASVEGQIFNPLLVDHALQRDGLRIDGFGRG